MSLLDQFPDIKDEDNPIVWCERCKTHHRYYTATRQDMQKIIDKMADGLADSIDKRIEEELFKP
jgi:hypothetical protein